ncbi:hypothetical protein [Acinetobacter baumannii]|uniref:hypothetical protein n=1 Tax=Acinetobacter baumannii TaxID=470 RepID=UPI0007A379BB|nr:hypothetical protein [Acinetobacter baumannii]EHU2654891.1 hypothetical protein [Acinetobacter baumannii]EHU2841944.1 hypothetical protein [Acinetobacter baumannii]EHU3381563.1 hypothetical protein [Acinetobacter baumannii]EHU3394184.1 hypothetical protein [Acinetobacter baumannii]KZA08804.1 hypothetical protein LV34_00958 [Acinetobacter baumannii]
MKYLNLIIIAAISVIILSILFFFGAKYFGKFNPDVNLTLTLYFFSGISTLGAVLSAIYTLHIQSIAKRPNIILQTTNLTAQYDDFIEKDLIRVGLKMLNTGENAFFLNLQLTETCINNPGVNYQFYNSRHDFDIFKSINDTEEHHYMELSFSTNSQDIYADIVKLGPMIKLTYQDQNHESHEIKYLLKFKRMLDGNPFFKLERIGIFTEVWISTKLFIRRIFKSKK